jgi:phospholipid/cholesterol/gamma-HCH transport system permease protein
VSEDDNILRSSLQGDRLVLTALGPWTAVHAHDLEPVIDRQSVANTQVRAVDIDLSQVKPLDTFGAWLIERLVRVWNARGAEVRMLGMPEDYRGLINEVQEANTKVVPPLPKQNTFIKIFEVVGKSIVKIVDATKLILRMLGQVSVVWARAILHPTKFRWTSMVVHIDRVGWNGVPIMLLVTFLIGCILAQQGIFHFRKFGADIFVIDMVGILVLREVGVLIVSVMIAGRSGSAYTAELGSMKMREEIDALRTMGFDPVEVLILPRIVALVISLPLLAFLGSMSALYGGGLVAWLYGGIQPEVFLGRLREAISLETFLVGIIKAPVMAFVIGLVAAVQGLQVEGSAESLGARTTSSVVISIFLVIVLDGFFAIFFASIGM